ncbi:MAG: glutamate--cysteine ligase [Austwickia sp.]|nr:glutamate--cysteine ligase [Austwickia sp.]MBK8435246.1 glutamate--cysteine ligase [Austwickia sp.]MBK9101202.1 glutamate--cysteine ligase [Austwickia sp.]
MGAEVSGNVWSHEQKQRYREKVRQDLDVFERMLANASFDGDQLTTGMEMELFLVGDDLEPSFSNAEVLEIIGHKAFQTELARYNVELNVDPRLLSGTAAFELESDLRSALNYAHGKAEDAGAHMVQVGILPTLMPEHFAPGWMSAGSRYAALNDAIMAARGENLRIDISAHGERFAMYVDSIAPESACTSVQLHLQVPPQRFAAYWNAAQVFAGPQVAVAANSPFLCGHALWHETRIPLFEQATDTRAEELTAQGVRARVPFGERWITSIFDLFEENVRYYPALLPELSDEDPVAVFEAGRAPALHELRLHNGTVWRWNRPIYDTIGDRPHLRVENRILPAGPTVIDVLANAALYYGVVAALADDERPIWTQMTFEAAQRNFVDAARDGLDARLYWPGYRSVPAGELVLNTLLPMAEEGLASWGVAKAVRDRYLGVIEGRCVRRQNGATWQRETVARLEGRGMNRKDALHEMLRLYCAGMHANQPVHEWELP